MVTLLFIAFVIVSIIGIGLYFWRSLASYDSVQPLPPAPDFRGMFGGDSREAAAASKELAIALREEEEASLIARAQAGEKDVLDDANKARNGLYDRVLNELVQLADSEQKLFALMSYVGTAELPVNKALASAVLASWQKSPDRSSTSKALHFAALSDDAEVYRGAVEQALQFWREGKLSDVSTLELRALFDGEFWILSSRTRSSGAGFVLKRTLDSARRELEAAASATQ
jgi:hypothetical protein